mmetsp:Transcript_81767/g.141764  ORF Transcript_81767/g.141764 Transcript_81767/m.141764 type:complete len:510 (-) Transcript_81767:101-1630(-)
MQSEDVSQMSESQGLPSDGQRIKRKMQKAQSLYSTVHDKHFKINGAVGHGIIQKRYLSGVLKVRVVQGSDLAAVWRGMPDPYVKISLLDASGWNAVRRTHTFASTCNPAWQEEFSFGIYREPIDLVLRLDVFDEDYDEQDDHLGAAMMPIKLAKMKEYAWTPEDIQLELDKENFPQSIKAGGSIEIRLNWTPLGNRAAGRMNILSGMSGFVNSPRAMGILGSLQVNLCGFLLLVSYHLRWLCKGISLEECHDVDVPGVGACTLIACTAALFGGVHQLFGSLGFLGKDWDVSPPGLISLLEDPDELESYHGEEEGTKLKIDLHSKGISESLLSLRVKNFKLVGVEGLQHSLHMLVWLQLVVAIAMTGLGLWLALAMKGADMFGEGVYMAAVVEILLLSSAGIFLRAAHLQSTDFTWKRFKDVKWQSKKQTNWGRKLEANVFKPIFHMKEQLTDGVKKAHRNSMDAAMNMRASMENRLADFLPPSRDRDQQLTGGSHYYPEIKRVLSSPRT